MIFSVYSLKIYL